MKLIKEPHPFTLGLGSLALCWLAAIGAQAYIDDLAVHAVMLGAFLPDWLLSFAKLPVWLWVLPVPVG